MNPVSLVQRAMLAYYAGDARRIQHFLKVYAYAKAIGELESLDAGTQFCLEIAALTHDIGIRNSERLYGSASGTYQQLEGPPEAQRLLAALPIDPAVTERVCWLIAHHHTYRDIQGLDYQILVEADFLVNLVEDGLDAATARHTGETLFKTQTGKFFLSCLYPSASE